MENTETILVTGATGLIGRRLIPVLLASGKSLVVLSRRPDKAAELGNGIRVVRALDELPSSTVLSGIVHLAGEPVAAKLWSAKRKQELTRSRAELPRQIGEWIAAAQQPPRVWLNASAIGWYGTPADPEQEFTEKDASGHGFAAELCAHIEASAEQALAAQSGSSLPRLVQLRIGLVLAPPIEGGYLASLAKPVKLFVGAVLGDGKQWQSWIHIDDAVRALVRCLDDATLQGPVNLTAPHPERASTLMKELGGALNRPVLFRVPKGLLRMTAGEMADDLLLTSQRVLPHRLLEHNFEFGYPRLKEALGNLLARR